MEEQAPQAGLRKVKRTQYVSITNDTVRDTRISYRALGVLTELLSHEEGWVVRTKDLARRRKEGSDAIGAALRELAAAGYYRVERRRAPSGKFSMGTAIADYPIPAWAEDFKRHPRGGVPVLVDENGHVIDDVMPDGHGPESPDPGFPDPVNPDPAGPDPVYPDPGYPGPGNPDPLEDQSQKTIPEDSAALRAATVPDPVETSSSSNSSVTREDAAAADDPADAPRGGQGLQSINPADILGGMLVNPDEAARFRTWLIQAAGSTNPDGLIVSLHNTGRLSERLSQWRASENPQDGYAVAYDAQAAPQRPARLEWCGRCDEHSRMREYTDEATGREYLARCRDCHVMAGIEQPGSGAHQVIAMQREQARRASGKGRAQGQAVRETLPEGVTRRNTTFGKIIPVKGALHRAESEHTA